MALTAYTSSLSLQTHLHTCHATSSLARVSPGHLGLFVMCETCDLTQRRIKGIDRFLCAAQRSHATAAHIGKVASSSSSPKSWMLLYYICLMCDVDGTWYAGSLAFIQASKGMPSQSYAGP